MKRKVNRFPYILAAILNAFACGVLFTWSYFREPLSQIFPSWTTSDLSLIFSLHNAVVCLSMLATGALIKRVSTRILFAAAAVLIGGGLGAYPLLPPGNPELALVLGVVFFGVIAAAGVGILGVSIFTVFLAWTPNRIGLMSGIMMMSYGACALVMGAIASQLIPGIGILSAIRILGLISAALIIVSLKWAIPPGSDVDLPPVPQREENVGNISFSAKEMLKSPLFWALFLANVMLRSSCFVYTDHAAGIATAFGAAALFGMLFSPANGVASILLGGVIDKRNSGHTIGMVALILLVASGALILGAAIGSTILVLAGLIATGVVMGGTNSVTSAAIRILFGTRNYGQNYSIMSITFLISSIICYLAGVVIERMGDNYNGVFYLTLIFSVVAIICSTYLAKKTSGREQQSVSCGPPRRESRFHTGML